MPTYHLTGLDVPARADVTYVDPFLSILLRVHQKPERILAKNGHATLLIMGLGESPFAADPTGSSRVAVS